MGADKILGMSWGTVLGCWDHISLKTWRPWTCSPGLFWWRERGPLKEMAVPEVYSKIGIFPCVCSSISVQIPSHHSSHSTHHIYSFSTFPEGSLSWKKFLRCGYVNLAWPLSTCLSPVHLAAPASSPLWHRGIWPGKVWGMKSVARSM